CFIGLSCRKNLGLGLIPFEAVPSENKKFDTLMTVAFAKTSMICSALITKTGARGERLVVHKQVFVRKSFSKDFKAKARLNGAMKHTGKIGGCEMYLAIMSINTR